MSYLLEKVQQLEAELSTLRELAAACKELSDADKALSVSRAVINASNGCDKEALDDGCDKFDRLNSAVYEIIKLIDQLPEEQ